MGKGGVVAVVVDEQLLEVVVGGGEDNLVAPQAASVARQSYVTERFSLNSNTSVWRGCL